MVDAYDRLDERVSTIQALEKRGDEIDDEVNRRHEARRLAAILDGQAVELDAALQKLDGLKDLERHLVAVHLLEKEADSLSRAAVAALFRDDALPPIEVLKWRDLYNAFEDTIDAAEDAAEAMERMYHKAN